MRASVLAHGLVLLMSTAHAAVVGTTTTPSVATNSGAPYCTTTLGPIPSPPSTVTWGPGRICEGLTGKTPHCCNGKNECRTNGEFDLESELSSGRIKLTVRLSS